MNIAEYWIQTLDESVAPSDGWETFPLTSYCGKLSKLLIDKTFEILTIADPHEHVTIPIKTGLKAAIDIICFG